LNSFTDTLRSLGPARLGIMVAVGAASIAFFIYLTSRLSTPDMALLYADLDPQDSGQIVSRLEQQDASYRLGRDGSQIFVPSDQVARLRVAMAADGLPSGGSIGYEIFDRSEGLGTTKFVQNVNHLRALEGELARTIRSIARVKHARVHLVLPKRELFTRDRQEPTASIVLTTQGNQRLAKQQVLAIQHLVAAAVPGLKPAMVSIVDSNGALLARGSDEDDSTGAASSAEEMRIAYQSRLARTIEEILERSVGPGNVRAQVTAEMDFDRVTENSETFDPDGQVVRSTQTIEEQSGSSDAQGLPPVTVGGNLPDANLPGAEGAASSSNAQRNEETVNYEISKTIKTHVRESGVVRRLSVAVLVNGKTTTTEEGEMAYEPRSPEELEQLAFLVRSAVGYDEARGDTVEVVNMRFVDPTEGLSEDEGGGLFGLIGSQLMRIAEVLVLGVVAVLVLLLVVRPLIGRVVETRIDEGAVRLSDDSAPRAAIAAPQMQDQIERSPTKSEVVAEEIDSMIDINKVEGRVRASSVKKIGEIVDKHPDEAVAILRNWLYSEG
jgi:flagellar M-ring protein FliF